MIELQDVQEYKKIECVLEKALYCHIAFEADEQPYVLPVSFGYKDGCLYFHSGADGKKMHILALNRNVGFAVEYGVELQKAKTACKFSMRYESVVGSGTATILQNNEEKAAGLDVIVRHYNGEPLEYSKKSLLSLAVVRIDIDEMTYKITQTGL